MNSFFVTICVFHSQCHSQFAVAALAARIQVKCARVMNLGASISLSCDDYRLVSIDETLIREEGEEKSEKKVE